MLINILILQIITFVGLLFVLRMLFYRQLNSALKRLHDLHEENLTNEAQLKEELERAKQERISNAELGREEAKALVEDAKKNCEVLIGKAQEDAKVEAKTIIDKGKQELELLKAQVVASSKDDALNLSMEIIKHTFAEEGKKSLQQQLIEELISEIERLDKEKLFVNTNKVKVTSSYPLTEEQREHLKKIIAGKINSDIEMEESIDSELITGLIIEIGTFVIDGSLANKLKKISAYIKQNR